MKAPQFWHRPGASLPSILLSPVGCLYGWATARRLRAGRPYDPGVPVICVGNLNAGGTGKTPVVHDLAARLLAAGKPAHVISKGYGAREAATLGAGSTRVDTARHIARQVGDETLMLARRDVPVWVGMDRVQSARAAAEAGAEVLIQDDGYQDPALVKTVSIVVVDGLRGFGNQALIPAGPLRESIGPGLARADAVAIMGNDVWGVADRVRRAGLPDLPVLHARIKPGPELARIKEQPVYAFAGTGDPEKFFRTLEAGGCRLAGREAFADHHAFTQAEIAAVKDRAESLGATPVTTEKDRARLSDEQARGIEVLTITLEWEDEAALTRVLAPVQS